MNKATKKAQPKPFKKRPALPADFEEDYARYQQLLGTLDGVETLKGKRHLFRKLVGLLDRLELGIWSQGGAG
jgi:hypothetical protein